MPRDHAAPEPGSTEPGPRGIGGEPGRGLTIRLFGGMSIEDPRGVKLLPRSRKTRAVVAILALSAPRPVLRAQMTALLWSQRGKEQARASLRQAIHELQASLGPAWNQVLKPERHNLALDLRHARVDALSATGAEMLLLFEEGFLDELSGLDSSLDLWLAREKQRLLDRARLGCEDLLEAPTPGTDAADAARSLLKIDPVHENAWRVLIERMLDRGDRQAALKACEQWGQAAGTVPSALAGLRAKIQANPQTPLQTLFETPPWASPGAGPDTDATAAVPASPDARSAPGRTSMRVGVWEMRVIGPSADRILSAGLAEELTTALSRIRGISCVSGSSLAAIAGEPGDTALRWPEIGLDLILDGTIQRVGPKVRITARLLDLRAGGEVLWARRFDCDATDTLSVQDSVAASIVAQIDPVLLMREGERAAAADIPAASSRDMVLRAVPAIYRLDRLSFHTAGTLLERALKREPGNADALAWYAYWHLFLVGQGWAEDPETATNRAASLAETAVSLDPNDARALTLAGHVRGFLMKRASEATVLHDRAISLNPNLALAWCFSGFSLSYLGDHDTAIVRMRQAIQLSPSDPHLFFFQMAIMMPHLSRGEYRAAALAGREAVELNPWFSSSFKGYLSALGHLGQARESADVLAKLLKLEPRFTVRDAIRRSPMLLPGDIERYAEGLRRAGLAED